MTAIRDAQIWDAYCNRKGLGTSNARGAQDSQLAREARRFSAIGSMLAEERRSSQIHYVTSEARKWAESLDMTEGRREEASATSYLKPENRAVGKGKTKMRLYADECVRTCSGWGDLELPTHLREEARDSAEIPRGPGGTNSGWGDLRSAREPCGDKLHSKVNGPRLKSTCWGNIDTWKSELVLGGRA